MNINDIIFGRGPIGDPAEERVYYDYIRRVQHYAFSRCRRRLRRFFVEQDINDGYLDLGGEA